MSTLTYDDNEGDHDASNVLNWLPTRLVIPINGDTIDIAAGVTTNPTTPITASGATLHFAVTTANENNVDLNAFIDRTGGTPDTIGNVTVNSAGYWVCGGNVGGTLNVTGTLKLNDGATVTGKITVNAVSQLSVSGTVVANGGIDVAGIIYLFSDAAILDTTTITATASTAAIDWNGGDIYGVINANGNTITHTNVASTSLLQVDVAGTLNLGSTDTSTSTLAVSTSAAVTLAVNKLVCGPLTVGANFNGGGKAIDAYGSVIRTAGTPSNLGLLTFKANGTHTWVTNDAGTTFKFSVDAGVTVTSGGETYCVGVGGAGAISIPNGKQLIVYTPATNFWTFTGTLTAAGTGALTFRTCGASVPGSPIVVSAPVVVWEDTTRTNTWSNVIVANSLRVNGPVGGVLTLAAYAVSCTDLRLGYTSSTGGGIVQANILTCNTIARTAATNVGCGVTIPAGGVIRLAGTFTGTGLTVTNNGGKVRKGGPAATLTAVTATGTLLDARGCINGGTNVNVRFGGVPSIATLAA